MLTVQAQPGKQSFIADVLFIQCNADEHRAQLMTWLTALPQDALRAERIASALRERQAQEAAQQAAAAAQAASAGTWAWVGNRLVHTPAAGAAAHPAAPFGGARLPPPGLDAQLGVEAPAGQDRFEQPGTAGPGASRDREQGHATGYEAEDGDDGHRGVRRRRRGGRRARIRLDNSRLRSGDGDDDEGGLLWDDGSSLHASEEFSEPGSATAELADDYCTSYFGAAPPLRRGSASGDGSERLAAQRHSGLLGGPNPATGRTIGPVPAGKSTTGTSRQPDAGDDEDVLVQLLGDLGVSERDQQHAQLLQSKSAQSPQRPSSATVSQPSNANALHSRQQYMPQAAASEAAAETQPCAGWQAMLGIRPAQPAAAQPKPPEDNFVFRVGFPHAAAGAAAPSAFRPPQPGPTRGPQHRTTAPRPPPQFAASPSAPQSVRAEPQAQHVPAANAAPAGRPAERGSGRRRPAVPQADALLLCPITQVRV